MKILITGAAGFVGSRLAQAFRASLENVTLLGLDNLSRRGSETNLPLLRELGCQFVHGDVRNLDDVQALPKADWIVDCAALPNVMAGINGGSAQLVGHNLIGTLNLLEKCRQDRAGFLMLSTSRVYSIDRLREIPLQTQGERFVPDTSQPFPTGSGAQGITEAFSTMAPVSLYGATKLASEVMALEYALAYDFPLWINRCGVIAGPGQFGKIDQGIISFWLYQWMQGKPLSYIGFGGRGCQVRDFLHPTDLAALICRQLQAPNHDGPKIINAGGGTESAISLRELSGYCASKYDSHRDVAAVPETRPFDIPYYVTDNFLAESVWNWKPQMSSTETLDSIADWAETNRALIEAGFG